MNTKFKEDILDLFSFKKGGHVQKWIYNDYIRPDGNTGSALWHSFVTSSKDYYLIQKEIDLIPELLKTIPRDFDTVIDFGLGNERAINNKVLPILLSQKNLKRYVAIDISSDILKLGKEKLEQQFNHLNIEQIHGDFYAPHKITGQNKLGIFLGSTISNQDMMIDENFPRTQIIKHLATLRETVKGNEKGSLILSIDTNSDLQNAMNSYQHPSWISLMTGLMFDVKKELEPIGDFNPSMWHYNPIINKKNHVIQHSISPTSDQNFSISGQEFNLKKGELFVIINCFKYPLEFFNELLSEAGIITDTAPTLSDEHSLAILNNIL